MSTTTATSGTVRARSSSGSPPAVKKPRLEAEINAPTQDAITVVAPQEKASKPKKFRGKKDKKPPPPEQGTSEDVNLHDIYSLLGQTTVDDAVLAGTEYSAPIPLYEEVELQVSEISSNGESISLLPKPHPPWAVLVPFALPGETIRARIYRHGKLHSYGDLVSVINPNEEMRDDSRVKCKYFGTCGGCQYQMLSYDTQLALKKRVVEKAYETYSGLDRSSVPSVLPTIPSPKQYAYRTKITPHFDAQPKSLQKSQSKAATNDEQNISSTPSTKKPWELRIGFDQKGRRTVMDIEECPIGTDVVNKGYAVARAEIREKISTYKRGATLLFRDSLVIPPKEPIEPDASAALSAAIIPDVEGLDDTEKHVCITVHKSTVRERVGSTLFEFPAGSFFQNNNSILEPLTTYVREAIFSPPAPSSVMTEGFVASEGPSTRRLPTHLVDTYCGSGLFSLTLSPHFEHIAGIEIDAQSIRSAMHNLTLNQLPTSKHAFHAGKSEDIFASVLNSSKERFPPEDTAVVIDPPRKGCDESFLNQVVQFGPSMLVYVSCNVHTQARDVGMLMRKMETAPGGRRYILESLRGFDLFPQTSHVESVAVLRLA